jgi:hypothetical protein
MSRFIYEQLYCSVPFEEQMILQLSPNVLHIMLHLLKNRCEKWWNKT